MITLDDVKNMEEAEEESARLAAQWRNGAEVSPDALSRMLDAKHKWDDLILTHGQDLLRLARERLEEIEEETGE